MRTNLSENERWMLALTVACIAAGMLSALIGLADDETALHVHVIPLLVHLHAAAVYGVTYIIPALVALAWVARLVWRRLHA